MKKNIPVEKEYLRTSILKRGTGWDELEPAGTSWNELDLSKTSWNHLELAGTSQN